MRIMVAKTEEKVILSYGRDAQDVVSAVSTPQPELSVFGQWKSGFSGKVQPVRLMMTLAA